MFIAFNSISFFVFLYGSVTEAFRSAISRYDKQHLFSPSYRYLTHGRPREGYDQQPEPFGVLEVVLLLTLDGDLWKPVRS